MGKRLGVKFTQEDVELKFIEKNFKLLSEYKNSSTKVSAQCKCGNIFDVIPSNVFHGTTQSCGCLRKTRPQETKLVQEDVERKFEELGFKLISKYENAKTKVETICHCGNKFFIIPGSIISQKTRSCGCLKNKIADMRKKPFEELQKEFEELDLILLTDYTRKSEMVDVECRCGKIFNAEVSRLLGKRITSCGCAIGSGHIKDLTGQVFGKLTVIDMQNERFVGSDGRFKIIWNCECSCGNLCKVRGDCLNGKDEDSTRSCGCLKLRHGAEHPLYKGEEKYKERNKGKSRRLRKATLKRDGHKCRVCELEDKKYVIHHLDGWDNHPEKRHDINNVLVACKECHKLFHDVYGYGKNTEDQFIEFYLNYGV